MAAVHPELVDAVDLDKAADRLEARGLLPHLVRQLIAATPGVRELDMPAEEAVVTPGWDGQVDGGAGSAFVPAGRSVWELGTDADARAKALSDYDKRTAEGDERLQEQLAFVFVSPRRWTRARDWAQERRRSRRGPHADPAARELDGRWREVWAFNADRLVAWMETAPAVHVWLSERLGKRPTALRTLGQQWQRIAGDSDPPMPAALLLAGRQAQAERLRLALRDPAGGAVSVQGGSRDEALAFMAAALDDTDDPDRADGPQPLWVASRDIFERLVLHPESLTLVLAGEGLEAGAALQAGHRVLMALGAGEAGRDGTIELPRLGRSAAGEALRASGVDFAESERLAALARRGFTAYRRAVSLAPGGSRAAWATGTDAPLLAALMLVGAWRDIPGDQRAVEVLTGMSMEAVQQRLSVLRASDDPPWTRSGGIWRLVSPLDALAMVGHLVDDALLTRWLAVAGDALGEPDPRAGMTGAELMLADVQRRPRREHSELLRDGLAQGAALLGVRSDRDGIPARDVDRRVARLVAGLLTEANADASGERWKALLGQLPELAEAAPDAVLDAVQDGLGIDPSPVLTLFGAPSKPATHPILERSSHPPLLWALEVLARSARHLQRAGLLLAELADRVDVPSGNSPAGSLSRTLMSWVPATDADLSARMELLDAVRSTRPEVGWELEMALVPQLHATSTPTHRPRFADWGAGDGQPDPQEVLDAYRHALRRALDDAVGQPRRWAALVRRAGALWPQPRAELFDRLEADDLSQASDEERRELWHEITEQAERHRQLPEAAWAMPAQDVDRMQALADRLEDGQGRERRVRLFNPLRRLDGLNAGDDFAAFQKALSAAQREAVAEELRLNGLAGVLALAERATRPWAVGVALSAGVDTGGELLELLGTEGAAGAMAAGWAAATAARSGAGWAASTLQDHPHLGPVARAGVLLACGTEPWVLDLVDASDEGVQVAYWSKAAANGVAAERVPRVVERLLAHGRAVDAIEVLAYDTDEQTAVDVDLAERALQAFAAGGSGPVGSHEAHLVGQLLDRLAAAGLEANRLAGWELQFALLLEHERQPSALHGQLLRSPADFVTLARHARGRDDGAPEADLRPGLEVLAWQVLYALEGLPGRREDGVIDPAAFDRWVAEVEKGLRAAGRAESVEHFLAGVMSTSPPGEDGCWPEVAVRELIERRASKRFEGELMSARFNRRGSTMRGLFDGGAQERQLVDELHREARTLLARWPRTARLHRLMAQDYEQDARHQDDEAEWRSDDG